MNNKKLGFTLVELLVVIAIIGVLTTLIMVNFVGSRERANDSQKVQNLTSIKNALRMYYNDRQSYPANLQAIKDGDYIAEIKDMDSIDYSLTNNGDGFLMKVQLESAAGVDTGTSQLNCGIAVGSTQAGVYAVCAN